MKNAMSSSKFVSNSSSGFWCRNEEILNCVIENDVVTLQVPGLTEAPQYLAPSRFCVHEWHEILVRGPAPLRVWCGNEPAKSVCNDFARFTFENQVGRTVISVQASGKWLPPLPIEVLSSKRPTPEEHVAFFSALVGDLADRQPSPTPVSFCPPAWRRTLCRASSSAKRRSRSGG